MREYVLSYNNDESFREVEIPFQYSYITENDYDFSYQRDSIFLTTNAMKSLVAISHSTRLFSLFTHGNDLFANVRKGIKLYKQGYFVDMSKPITIIPQSNFVYMSKPIRYVSKMMYVNMSKPIILHTHEIVNIINNDINDYDYHRLARKLIHLDSEEITYNRAGAYKLIETKTIFGKANDNITNYFENLMAYKGNDEDKNILLNEYNIFGGKDTYITHIRTHEDTASSHDNYMVNNSIYTILCESDNNIANVYENINAAKISYIKDTLIDQFALGYPKNHVHIPLYDMYHYSANVYNKSINKKGYYDNIYFVYRESLLKGTYKDWYSIFNMNDYKYITNIQSLYHVHLSNTYTLKDYKSLEAVNLIDEKYLSYYNNISLWKDANNSCNDFRSILPGAYKISLGGLDIYDTYDYLAEDLPSDMTYREIYSYANKLPLDVDIILPYNTFGDNSFFNDLSLYYKVDDMFIVNARDIDTYNEYNDFYNKFALPSDIHNKYNTFTYRSMNNLNERYNTNDFFIKTNNDIHRFQDNVFIEKVNTDLDVIPNTYPVYFNYYVSRHSEYHSDMERLINIPRIGTVKGNGLFINNFKRKTDIILAEEWINNIQRPLDIIVNGIHVCKDELPTWVKDDTKFLIKEAFPTFTKDTIISCNKLAVYGFTSKVVGYVKNSKKTHGLLNEDVFAYKDWKGTSLYDDPPLVDKLYRNVAYLKYEIEECVKSAINARFTREEDWLYKNRMHFQTYNRMPSSVKAKFITNIFGYDFAFKNRIGTKLDKEEEFADKQRYIAGLFTFDSFETQRYYCQLFNQCFGHMYKPLMYQKYIDLGFKDKIYTTINKDDMAERPILRAQRDYYDITPEQIKIARLLKEDLANKYIHAQIFEHVFMQNTAILRAQVPGIDMLEKIAKEMDLMHDREEFAWVYEEEPPMDERYGLDELLLPEQDMQYEEFEDIIFNKEKGVPRNPVKINEDGSFIAKYPIKYPFKGKRLDDNPVKTNDSSVEDYKTPRQDEENSYANVARDYFPVRTDILKEVILEYYKLWQDNIFEFSRMTETQSSKKMLDYLYTWIIMHLPPEDHYEAFRCFRLVRWYLEASVIECSEYHITYKRGDLTSGRLDTTDFPIPSSLNVDPSMYIDVQQHVIRNNEHMMKGTLLESDATLILYIDNKKPTTISFYLNSEQPTDIILNGNIIDHIAIPTCGKLMYNIPYTEDTNEFTIKRPLEYNTDPRFFIGNIKIEGMGKDGQLDIDFIPKLQGNKVLSHVSAKALQLVNMYENNQEILDSLTKGNAHLDDVYTRLEEYWNKHHEAKEKGKRWTIKHV